MSPDEVRVPSSAVGPSPVVKRDTGMLVIISIVGILLFCALMRFVPFGPIIRPYLIPSSSMMPSIPIGTVLADRFAYGLSSSSFDWVPLPISGRWPNVAPQRGDVIVFRLPREPGTVYIKRLIGLPGERVQMIKGRLSINGQIVRREEAAATKIEVLGKTGEFPTYTEYLPGAAPYLIVEAEGDAGPYDNTAEFTIPAGHYFFMGDNRDNSTDSRISADQGGVGLVPSQLLLGKVIHHWTGNPLDFLDDDDT